MEMPSMPSISWNWIRTQANIKDNLASTRTSWTTSWGSTSSSRGSSYFNTKCFSDTDIVSPDTVTRVESPSTKISSVKSDGSTLLDEFSFILRLDEFSFACIWKLAWCFLTIPLDASWQISRYLCFHFLRRKFITKRKKTLVDQQLGQRNDDWPGHQSSAPR